MLALSIRQRYAELILRRIRTMEYRNWRTSTLGIESTAHLLREPDFAFVGLGFGASRLGSGPNTGRVLAAEPTSRPVPKALAPQSALQTLVVHPTELTLDGRRATQR